LAVWGYSTAWPSRVTHTARIWVAIDLRPV
jgi:hypothetical protein